MNDTTSPNARRLPHAPRRPDVAHDGFEVVRHKPGVLWPDWLIERMTPDQRDQFELAKDYMASLPLAVKLDEQSVAWQKARQLDEIINSNPLDERELLSAKPGESIASAAKRTERMPPKPPQMVLVKD